MRLLVSYTYPVKHGDRQYVTEVIDIPYIVNFTTEEHALLYVRNEISTEGALLGVWPARSLRADFMINGTSLPWEGIDTP